MRTQSSRAKFIPSTPNLAWLSSVAIPAVAGPQRGPETLFSTPKGYPFKVKDGSPIKVGVQFFADVPLGRMLQIIFAFRSDVVAGEVKRAGAGWRASSSRPRRSVLADGHQADSGRSQSKAPECWRAQRRPVARLRQ
jgi:hypothetical protein